MATATRKGIDRARKLAAKIKPRLAGHPPEVISIALADLAATLIASHNPALRETVYNLHCELIRDLVPENEKEVFGELGFPKHLL